MKHPTQLIAGSQEVSGPHHTPIWPRAEVGQLSILALYAHLPEYSKSFSSKVAVSRQRQSVSMHYVVVRLKRSFTLNCFSAFSDLHCNLKKKISLCTENLSGLFLAGKLVLIEPFDIIPQGCAAVCFTEKRRDVLYPF